MVMRTDNNIGLNFKNLCGDRHKALSGTLSERYGSIKTTHSPVSTINPPWPIQRIIKDIRASVHIKRRARYISRLIARKVYGGGAVFHSAESHKYALSKLAHPSLPWVSYSSSVSIMPGAIAFTVILYWAPVRAGFS